MVEVTELPLLTVTPAADRLKASCGTTTVDELDEAENPEPPGYDTCTTCEPAVAKEAEKLAAPFVSVGEGVNAVPSTVTASVPEGRTAPVAGTTATVKESDTPMFGVALAGVTDAVVVTMGETALTVSDPVAVE